MAYNYLPYVPSSLGEGMRFSYDPFYLRPAEEVNLGDSGPMYAPERWVPSDAIKQENPWLYNEWSNQSNMEIVQKLEDGGYLVKIKTGDKQGTVYHVAPDENGGFSNRGVIGNEYWNTNSNFLSDYGVPLAILSMPFIGPGGLLWESGAAGAGAAATDLGAGWVGENRRELIVQGWIDIWD